MELLPRPDGKGRSPRVPGLNQRAPWDAFRGLIWMSSTHHGDSHPGAETIPGLWGFMQPLGAELAVLVVASIKYPCLLILLFLRYLKILKVS